MNTNPPSPKGELTEASKDSAATQEKAKEQRAAKKNPYGTLTSFIFSKLLLGDKFVASYRHNSGTLTQEKKSEERSSVRRQGRLHKTPNRVLYRVSARTFGVFFFTFGIFLLLLYLFGHRIFSFSRLSSRAFISSLIALMIGLPLIPFSAPASSVFSGSRLLSFILCDLLSMKRLRMVEEPFRKGTNRLLSLLAFVLGVALAFLSYFVSPLLILGILLLLSFICCAFAAPECCLVIAALILPWLSLFKHPSIILASLTLLLTLAYGCKILRRKRTFVFTVPDALVLILALFYMLGGVHALGSGFMRSHGVLYAILIFVYFPASNILRDRRILHRTLSALLFSGVISAIFGIYQHFTSSSFKESLDSSALGYISGRVSSFFRDGPNVFAVYLLLLFPLCLYLLTAVKHLYSRFFALFPLGLTVLALVFTWSRGAWVGALVAFFIFLILAFRRRPTVLLVTLAAIPFILLLLPDSAIEYRFASIGNLQDSSIAYRLSTWRGALALFSDHFLAGVGAGAVSFKAAFPFYALPGTETAAHAHNLFLEMGIELGIFAPITLLLLVTVLVFITLTHPIRRGTNELRILQIACFSSIIGALTQSMTDYIFYNPRLVFLFFLIVGMTVACARRQAEDHVRDLDFSSGSEENASTEIIFKK